jgi:tryptophanyl-tRNA synthetase
LKKPLILAFKLRANKEFAYLLPIVMNSDLNITPANGPRLYPIELQYEPRVISGFRPTVEPHLGLHSGVLQHIVNEQNRHPGGNYCLIADWHATTMWFGRANMQEATLTTAAALLALGVNPYKTLLCAQSHLSGLGEMAWLLSCMTPESLLLRNPVSPGSALNKNNIGAILYPVLMAADVLSLRGTKIVIPRDQIINCRKVRQIGRAANHMLGTPLFPIPAVEVRGGVVPGIDGNRMDWERRNHISMFLSPSELRRRIQLIQTDSSGIKDPKNPETCTVFRLYSLVAPPQRVREMHERYLLGAIGYEDAKAELAIAIAERYSLAREHFEGWKNRPDDLRDILRAGAKAISMEVKASLALVREKLGLDL